jgi:lysophospholipase L1-like esterase
LAVGVILSGSVRVACAIVALIVGILVMRRYAVGRILLVNVVILLASMLAIEGGLRIVAHESPPDVPVPYRGAAYYDGQFALERERFIAFTGSDRLWSERDDGSGPYRANGAFDGTKITIIDGVRTTSSQPAEWAHSIWMLGGSTMLSGEVPDPWTIPSLLQAADGVASHGFRVVNLGVNAASVGGNLDQLRGQAKLQSGDVVVVYGGVNNVRGMVDEGARWQLGHEMLTSRLVDPWRRRSQLLKWVGDVVNAPMLSYSEDEMQAGLEELESDLMAARRVAMDAGARLLFVLQPNLFLKADPSGYERNLAGRWQPIFRRIVERNYDGFRAMTARHPDWMVDVSGVLDDAPDSPYFDWMHVSHLGNEPVAGAIHAELARRGWLADE